MKIWTLNLHRQFINFLIIIMLVVVSMLAVLGVSLTTTSSVINGVYYSGNTDSNKISLMINVYWGTEYLDGMLEILDRYEVKTTFFVGGTWAVKESDMLKKIYDAGHEIGNHGYSHKDQDKLNREQNKNEILTTHTLVNDLIGVNMDLFAPPSGAYNKTTVEVATELGYKTIGVIGCGLDKSYPKENDEMYEKMKKDQLLLSEYPAGSLPLAHHFPWRNRILAALGDRCYVVEAKSKSGTMITADYVQSLNKEIIAFPYRFDDDFGIGCNYLIEQGASIFIKER